MLLVDVTIAMCVAMHACVPVSVCACICTCVCACVCCMCVSLCMCVCSIDNSYIAIPTKYCNVDYS